MIRWLWLSLLVIVLDQVSKQLVEAAMTKGETLVLTPFLNLVLAYNPGAAFSILSDQDGWQRWVLSALAIVLSLFLIVWLSRLKQSERWIAVSLSLIVGGAIGNAIDRLLFSHVIDFIQLHYAGFAWPAFNVADSAISVGVAIMLLDIIVLSRRRE